MGFHVGLIGAGCKWHPLMDGLASRAQFTPIPYADDPEHENWDLEVFEHPHGTTLIDNRFYLSKDNPDLLVDLSAQLATTIAAFYAETISGSYGLLIAESGTLRRLYHRCNAATRGELTLGSPFPSEAIDPLTEINGNGGLAVLEHYGFVGPTLEDTITTKLRFQITRHGTPDGPISQMIAAFTATHAIPDAQQPGITAIGRIVPPAGRIAPGT
jgi:hypothetical protein